VLKLSPTQISKLSLSANLPEGMAISPIYRVATQPLFSAARRTPRTNSARKHRLFIDGRLGTFRGYVSQTARNDPSDGKQRCRGVRSESHPAAASTHKQQPGFQRSYSGRHALDRDETTYWATVHDAVRATLESDTRREF